MSGADARPLPNLCLCLFPAVTAAANQAPHMLRAHHPPRPRAHARAQPGSRCPCGARTAAGPPEDWEQQLGQVTAVLENLQATISSGTLLDAASTSELKQQQLNLKLKAKVREQKLQKQVEELEEELTAARKSAEVRRRRRIARRLSLSLSLFRSPALPLSLSLSPALCLLRGRRG